MSETVVQESMNETTAKIVFLFINDMEIALVIDVAWRKPSFSPVELIMRLLIRPLCAFSL
jgi:hypothetical protein